MTNPLIFAEIYQLLLNKHFRPELKTTDKSNVFKLYLWAPNSRYYTIYELSQDKIRWTGGVFPLRILK